MAAKTPSAVGSSALVGDVELFVPLYSEAVAFTPVELVNVAGCRRRTFYFADVDASDTWSSGIVGIVSLAWSNEGTGGVANALQTADGGVIAMAGSSANRKGWLTVYSKS